MRPEGDVTSRRDNANEQCAHPQKAARPALQPLFSSNNFTLKCDSVTEEANYHYSLLSVLPGHNK
jgi:hypothetical protein